MHLRSLSHVLSLASRSLGGSRSLSPHAGKGRLCAPQLAHARRIRDPGTLNLPSVPAPSLIADGCTPLY